MAKMAINTEMLTAALTENRLNVPQEVGKIYRSKKMHVNEPD